MIIVIFNYELFPYINHMNIENLYYLIFELIKMNLNPI
jgi:hypothetical protein